MAGELILLLACPFESSSLLFILISSDAKSTCLPFYRNPSSVVMARLSAPESFLSVMRSWRTAEDSSSTSLPLTPSSFAEPSFLSLRLFLLLDEKLLTCGKKGVVRV